MQFLILQLKKLQLGLYLWVDIKAKFILKQVTHLWLTFVQGSHHVTQVRLEKDHSGIHHLELSTPVATATIECWT